MGLDITKLKPQPSLLEEGITDVTLTYNGVIDDETGNPVKLTLFIQPSAPAFFIKDGNRVKTINSTEVFSQLTSPFSWNVQIEITDEPNTPMSCSLRLEAKDSLGNRSSVNSFFIFH